MTTATIQDLYAAIAEKCGWGEQEVDIELSGDCRKPFWVMDSDRAVNSSFEGCVAAVESWAHDDSLLYW